MLLLLGTLVVLLLLVLLLPGTVDMMLMLEGLHWSGSGRRLLLGTLKMVLLLLLGTVDMLLLDSLHGPGSGRRLVLVTGMMRWAWHRCCCSAQPVLGQELVTRHAQLSPPGLVCNSRHTVR